MTEYNRKNVKRRRKLQKERRSKIRLFLLIIILFIGSGTLLHNKDRIGTIAEVFDWFKQYSHEEVITSNIPSVIRGDIYDRNFRPLAVTYKTFAIYARPLEMENHESSAAILAEILGLKKAELLASLKSERGFTWIAKGLNQEIADSIESRDIKGIYQVVENNRFYPNSEKAAHVVGFVENGQGLDGIEYEYNTILRGDELNSPELESLNFSNATDFGESNTHLVLNLDLMIQSKIENFLNRRIKITGASRGTVILMDANTGGIIALASHPPFNPNKYWEFPSSALKNNALSEPVYPGELSLIFQQAAAINLKNTPKPESLENLNSATSVLIINPDKLKRRKLSTAPMVDNVDKEYLLNFARILGFNQQTTTDLPLKDETPASSLPINSPLFKSSALKLLNGFTTLLNGGRLLSPHLLHRAYQKESVSPFETTLNNSEQAIALNQSTSKHLSDFLATKWLKNNHSSKTPMFFEAHRYATPVKNITLQDTNNESVELKEETPYLAQSIMLGAIPGENPKLTMVAVLSYPDSCDPVYPDAMESFRNKFSLLTPGKEMIKKMLQVTKISPPNPSPDFWEKGGAMLAKNSDSSSTKEIDAALSNNLNRNMPDVTGKSLRAGLQVLQNLNLDIRLVGSGKIMSQRPAAGAELKNISECTLKMQQEI